MRSLLTTHSSASTIEKMKLLVLLLVTILVTVRKSEESSVDFVAVKLGTCPVSTGVGTCAEECSNDGKCPGREKCCSNGCGHACMEPIEYSRVKSGNCPRRVGKGTCVEKCSWDDECPGKQKCCSNGCGHVCMDPYVFPKPKVCLMCCGPPPCCSYCGLFPDLRRRQQNKL